MIIEAMQQKQRQSDLEEVRAYFPYDIAPDCVGDLSDTKYKNGLKILRKELREIEENSLMRKLVSEIARRKREKTAEIMEALEFDPVPCSLEKAIKILREAAN